MFIIHLQLKSSDWLIKHESEEFEHVREEVQSDTDFETRRKTMAIIQMAEQRILTCKCIIKFPPSSVNHKKLISFTIYKRD
jgi:hypothetical protein